MDEWMCQTFWDASLALSWSLLRNAGRSSLSALWAVPSGLCSGFDWALQPSTATQPDHRKAWITFFWFFFCTGDPYGCPNLWPLPTLTFNFKQQRGGLCTICRVILAALTFKIVFTPSVGDILCSSQMWQPNFAFRDKSLTARKTPHWYSAKIRLK